MFGSIPERKPDAEHDGIRVWIDEQKGGLFVLVRMEDPKTNRWRLIESHSGVTGGEFRFELKQE